MQRRNFLRNATIASLVAKILPANILQAQPLRVMKDDKEKGFTVLFQGDSITDGNRTRNNDWNHVMGHGYAYNAASRLWCDFPERQLHFFNRGISGNKITDLTARWQTDTIDLQPDVLSILIGINDCSTFIKGNKDFSAANFESDYRLLLKNTKQALPNVALVLCDPFVLPVGNVLAKQKEYEEEVGKRQEIVKRLAVEFDAVHIDFQKVFNNALKKAAAPYWMWDGIHPMPAGHELMAREWIIQVGKKMPQLSYGT